MRLLLHGMFGRPNFGMLMGSDFTVCFLFCLFIFMVGIFKDKTIIVNGHASKNTNFKWKKYDGTDLKYTIWGNGHPVMYSGVAIFAHYNGKVTRGHQRSKLVF